MVITMNRIDKKLIFLILLAIALICSTSCMLSYNFIKLRIQCMSKNGYTWYSNIVVSQPLLINVSFIHSVHRVPEHDIVILRGRNFYLWEVWVQAFGAGVPLTPNDVGGGYLEFHEDFVVFKDIGKYIGKKLILDMSNAIYMSVEIDDFLVITKPMCQGVLIIEIRD